MKIAILIIALFLNTCGGKHVQFDGAVIDSSGNPVANAEVQFMGSQGGKSDIVIIGFDRTDGNGVFTFRTKDGYKRVDRIVAVHENGRIKTNTVKVPSAGKSGVILSFD